MAKVQLKPIDLSETASFRLKLNTAERLASYRFSNEKQAANAVVSQDGRSCHIPTGDGGHASKQFGTVNEQKSSFVIRRTLDEDVLELVPLDTEYDFTNDQAESQDTTKGDSSTSPSDEPDPNNPYDYRHYLNNTDANGWHSPAPSTIGTPILAATPHGSSPVVFLSDADELPSMAVTRRDRKIASQKAERAARKPQSRRPDHPVVSSSPVKPARASPINDKRGTTIDSDPQRAAKRQRLIGSEEARARADAQAITTSDDASSGYEDDVEDEDGDVEDLELTDTVNERPQPPPRRQSVLDAEAVILAAFEEEEEEEGGTSTPPPPPNVQTVQDAESESEEE